MRTGRESEGRRVKRTSRERGQPGRSESRRGIVAGKSRRVRGGQVRTGERIRDNEVGGLKDGEDSERGEKEGEK